MNQSDTQTQTHTHTHTQNTHIVRSLLRSLAEESFAAERLCDSGGVREGKEELLIC